ncbi:MAG: MFS transporter [Herpetosiphonaceae bacterium]|nr:MFS transporter [Herpetosiphonaceae bacterium]
MQLSNTDQGDDYASNIPRYFVYIALKGFGFAPIAVLWVIYLQQQRGLSLAQAALVDATFFITALFSEVPTGVVADRFGRKVSLTIGAALMAAGVLAWTFAPTIPLIMLAYAALAIGFTFLSGADDAFFYETLQRTGRASDYTRLVARAGATNVGALALGSVASSLLASVDLRLPFLVASLSLLIMMIVVLSFKEPKIIVSDEQARTSIRQVLQQSVTLLRDRPSLRFPMLYVALIPVASVIMETLFLQPQALAVGVPLASIGIVALAAQLASIGGSMWSTKLKGRVGEGRILTAAPVLIIACLLLLSIMQLAPALLFIAGIGFLTAVVNPIVLNRMQDAVSDDIRATTLSLQSLLFSLFLAGAQPSLGFVADRFGLPAAYVGLASGLGILMLCLLWTGRQHVQQAEPQAVL